MILLGLATFRIADDALRIFDPKLGGHVGNDSHRDVHRIRKKGSQESKCANLHREAEPIVVSTTLSNKLTIFIVQVKQFGKRVGAILGICGGYQMLGEQVSDPSGVEAEAGTVEPGLGLLPLETVFGSLPEKVTQRSQARLDVQAKYGLFANAGGCPLARLSNSCRADASSLTRCLARSCGVPRRWRKGGWMDR